MDKVGRVDFPAQDPSGARSAVIRKAHALIAAARSRFPQWDPPPFDPALYASVLDIPVHYEATPQNWDALYIPLPGKERIVINRNVRSRGRRRFSLAHEIVHSWFDDPGGKRYFQRTRDRKAYERDEYARSLETCCDAGAAELIMPQPWFGDELQKIGLRAAAIPGLAEKFEVSLEAAALRVVETGGAPLAVGFFEFAPRATESRRLSPAERGFQPREFRVRRLFKTRDFPFLFPAGKSVPRSSAVYTCSLNGKEMDGAEDFTLGASTARLRVSACPLMRNRRINHPPAVCAVFQKD